MILCGEKVEIHLSSGREETDPFIWLVAHAIPHKYEVNIRPYRGYHPFLKGYDKGSGRKVSLEEDHRCPSQKYRGRRAILIRRRDAELPASEKPEILKLNFPSKKHS